MDLVLSFNNSANLLTDARQIIDKTKELAFRSVNVAMLQRNWYLGKRISEEILQGEDRAEYGSQVILQLSKELTDIYGKGFTKSYLYNFVRFYKSFSNYFQTFSQHCRDNPNYSLGRTILCYCLSLTMRRERGMQTRHIVRDGVFARCNAIYLRSITIACFCRSTKRACARK